MSQKREIVSNEILTLRTPYINAINKIVPNDPLEVTDIQDALEWLQSAPQITKTLDMQRHLGVIFLVLSPDREFTFMLNHKKAQTWLPPGGHVDTGLSFQDAVKLEMREKLQKETVFFSI